MTASLVVSDEFSPSKKQNVLLIGSGGVGTVASVALEKGGHAHVTSVLRSDYEKVKQHGFSINSVDHGKLTGWRPSHVVNSVEKAVEDLKTRVNDPHAIFDYIVVAIKALPDIVKTEDVIRPAMQKKSIDDADEKDQLVYPTVVLIQNGIDMEKPIVASFPGCICLSGISMIGSHNFGGHIEQYEHDIINIGYFDNGHHSTDFQGKIGKQFVYMYAASKVNCKYVPDLMFWRWRKLVYNSTYNTMCGLMQLDVGRCYLSGIDEAVILPAMDEIVSIAKAAGYDLPHDIKKTMQLADEGLYYKPSMQIDIEKGNPVEIEAILGNPLRIARELKVETPILRVVYNLLKGVQFRLLEGRKVINVPEKPPMFTDPTVQTHCFPSEFSYQKK